MHYAVMVALGILIGIAASFTGLGGGFIMVPLLIFLGFTAQKAVGTSFMAILIISTSALFAHGKLNHVDYRLGILIKPGGHPGSTDRFETGTIRPNRCVQQGVRNHTGGSGRPDVFSKVTGSLTTD